MARYIAGGTVHFLKIFPHDEVLRKVAKGHRNVLDVLVSWAIVEQRTVKVLSEAERDRIAGILKCEAKSVSNALCALSKPSYDKGPEILIKLGPSTYMLNPSYYFIGEEEKRQVALERVRIVRAANKRKRDQRKKQPSRQRKPATVTPLHIVQA